MDAALSVSDPSKIRKARARERFLREEEMAGLRALLDGKGGRRYLWKALEEHHIFQTSFSQDAGYAAFREGERNGGLKLLDDILEANQEAFFLMIRENRQRPEDGPETEGDTQDE